MILKTIDRKIAQAFSDAAYQYDVLTSLHKEIGRDLIKKIQNIEFCDRILDIGMGTGWLTNKLTFYFPESNIVGLDFAPGMVTQAKKHNDGFHIIEANACALPFKDSTFDIIVSNLTYQWIEHLSEAFRSCHASLKPKGHFLMTLFGFETFKELFVCLENSVPNNGDQRQCSMRRLPRREDIEKAMELADFHNIHIDYERIKVHFLDCMSLIKWIKDIGANCLQKDIFIGKELLARTNDYYEQNFKDRFGIYATFEVIWVKAQK